MSTMDKMWNQLSLVKRTAIVATFALCLTMLAGAMHLASQPPLVNLITANERVIAEIKDYLEQNHIEHTVTSPNTILVDESIKAKTLLMLAREDLIGIKPSESYEIIDEFSFGMTDDMYELNKKRVLENKLAQLIMDGHLNISKAYVNLDLPDTEKPDTPHEEPTATVKIVIHGNVQKRVVTGIQNLIASSVAGMKLSHIAVMDGSNKLLSQHEKEIDTTILLDEEEEILFEQQRHLQKMLQRMIQNHSDTIQSVYVILNLNPVDPSSSIKVISDNPLSSDEIKGIETLVVNAVDQLETSDIFILDNNNRVLNQDIYAVTE